jgi:DNA-binding response OmpR family regulator
MTTVLLMEPDNDSAGAYAQWLQRAGFRVITAGEELPPDLVIIGVSNVGQSLNRVSADGRDVPRIIVSSDAGDQRLATLGCAILIRPVMYDDLVTAVRRVLKAATT